MLCMTAFAIVFFTSVAAADDKPLAIPEPIVRVFERSEKHRRNELTRLSDQIDAHKRSIEKTAKGPLVPKAKEELNRQDEARLSSLQSMQARLLGNRKLLLFPDDSFPTDVGSIGSVSSTVVFQKHNDNEGLVSIIGGDRNQREFIVYCKGISFKDKFDGTRIDLPMIKVTGVHSYQTNAGKKSVPLYEPADEQLIQKMFAQWLQPVLIQEQREKEEKKQADDAAKADAQKRVADKVNAKKESDATAQLNGAKFMHSNGNTEKAKQRLKDIIRDYGGTDAAKEAAALLDKW